MKITEIEELYQEYENEITDRIRKMPEEDIQGVFMTSMTFNYRLNLLKAGKGDYKQLLNTITESIKSIKRKYKGNNIW